MRVIGTVGLPGSGKGEVAAVARESGVPVVTMGDVVRRECRDRGLDPAERHGEVARALRAENGPGAVAERSLPLIEERAAATGGETVLVDGLRSPAEAEQFERAFADSFLLVSVEAPYELRAERVDDRGRDRGADDGGETLRERDERERGFGVEDVMARADVTIRNAETLDRLRERVRTLLAEGPAALAGDEGVETDADSGAETV